ncbi:MAG: hypothetical protein WAV40_04395 [Microgenomates group bacterium]
MTKTIPEDLNPWVEASLQNMKNWRSWGSWFSWGSPVGLGLFFLALAGSAWILMQAF